MTRQHGLPIAATSSEKGIIGLVLGTNEPDDHGETFRRDRRTFLISVAIWTILAIPVDRDRTTHVEIREMRLWEVPVLVTVVLAAAFATYCGSKYGKWSFVGAIRRLLRDVAIVELALAVVVTLYGVSLLFR